MTNWLDIHYLLQGGVRQHAAYHALKQLGIMTELADFDPILVGTIPLNLDIPSSDLDIVLYVQDYQRLAQIVRGHYRHLDNFEDRFCKGAYIANFFAQGFEFELFAQNIPTTEQNAFRHMLIEYRILHLGDDELRQTIREMKKAGIKTEPAFAQYFHLEGDPYQALLELETLDDESLKKRLNL
jgi:hypothetical protein